MISKISIVTVCYNALDDLAVTVNSILGQTFTDFEYLIIDGASEDGTVSFIESKVTDFITRGIAFRYISEPDKGIYDAMNKAAHYADNDYLLFLNAGDEFYAGDTLLNVQKQLCETDADIVYGSTLFCGNGVYQVRKPKDLNTIIERMPFCHQSVLVRTSLLLEHPFDLHLNVCADYESFVFFYMNNYSFQELDCVIARFVIGGTSQNLKLKYYRELYEIHKMYGIPDSKFHLYRNLLLESCRSKIRKILPKQLLYIKNRIINRRMI